MQTCNILGVHINVTDMDKTVKYIVENLDFLKGKYICISNVHTTVMAYENEEYRNVQNSAELALPDGGPLSFISKKRGYSNAKRVTGPDLMEELFKISEDKLYTHFFYGSTNEILEQLKIELYQKYPNMKIVGMYSPPFRELTYEEDQKIIEMINEEKPNFVWVGLGAPKQENWMFKHQGKIQSVMIGVGAGFEYHSGSLKRAPKWMQQLNLEWVCRLIQNPRRLFKRYFTTNTKFIYLMLVEKVRGL